MKRGFRGVWSPAEPGLEKTPGCPLTGPLSRLRGCRFCGVRWVLEGRDHQCASDDMPLADLYLCSVWAYLMLARVSGLVIVKELLQTAK